MLKLERIVLEELFCLLHARWNPINREVRALSQPISLCEDFSNQLDGQNRDITAYP